MIVEWTRIKETWVAWDGHVDSALRFLLLFLGCGSLLDMQGNA